MNMVCALQGGNLIHTKLDDSHYVHDIITEDRTYNSIQDPSQT